MQLPSGRASSTTRRNAEICTVRLLSSTTICGQTAAMISSFETTSPARSISTARMSSARDRDRLKLAGTIAPQQATAPFEAEALEQENVGRSNSLHARSPAVSSEDARRETASRDQGFIRAAFWNIS